MKLTFLGGADEVGASCTLLEVAGKRLLIDAGIRISPKSSRGIENSQLPDLQPISAMGGIDYLLVTHAHTDHTGALPLVVSHYPDIPVYMTRPTEALTRVLQKDAQRIMQSQYEEEGELPLYDEVAVDRLMQAIQIVEFQQPIQLGDGIQVTYHVAGHIAGAAMLIIETSEGTLVMSGDVSKSPQRTVQAMQPPKLRADALVIESTYGDRMHANREAEERRLIDTLLRITEGGGRALIPAFALGRAQEIIQILLAYSDRLTVPVYVDGMVRSVCDAYARFADLLPPATVRAAGDSHLFFRHTIKPVRSTQHRQELAMSSAPGIIIASSGMMTGGASAFFARHIAPEPASAILLTGYQDEEAPGRFLQRLMKERQDGEEPMLRLGKETTVPVRCQIDTYSLSAHADRDELVSLAQAFKAGEVMTVHGNASARHSLATELRRRQMTATSPKIGSTREFAFKAKPWAVGVKLAQGARTDTVNIADLWQSLKLRAGNYFGVRELAQVWWGDGERAAEMGLALLHPDNIYFTPDWRSKTTFLVKSEAQVQRSLRQRQIMLAYPDLVGKLVVLRNSNDQPRIGVVKAADVDSFEADAIDSKGTHFPADALLWVIGPWAPQPQAEGSLRTQLNTLLAQARQVQEEILPFSVRQQVAVHGAAIKPEMLLPDVLPTGVTRELALLAIVWLLAADGATLEPDGLHVQRALEHGPLEQNEARAVAMAAFPPEARLRKVGLDVNRRRLTFYFDFPALAAKQYAVLLTKVTEQTGWETEVNPSVNQQALASAILELLPAGARIVKGPSFFIDKGEVQIEVANLVDSVPYTGAYAALTGFKLIITQSKAAPVLPVAVPLAPGQSMEINQAFAYIQQRLREAGLYRASLKQGQIVLTFISPQVGERHQAAIAALSAEIGYGLSIHPHPNQQQILEVARQLCDAAGWLIRKGPGIHVDRAEVAITLAAPPDAAQWQQLEEAFHEQTGYRIVAGSA